MRFTSWSTRAYLMLALGGALVVTGVSAGIEWWGIERVRVFVASVRHGDIALAESVGNLHDDLLQLRRYEKDVFINLASAPVRDGYRSKWDDVFLHLRYDLMRARALVPEPSGGELQEFADAAGEYRSAFVATYDAIREGTVATPQQANERMGDAKEAAHRAEQRLLEIERNALLRMQQFGDPVSDARWASLALHLLLLAMIGGPLAWTMRQQPRASALRP